MNPDQLMDIVFVLENASYMYGTGVPLKEADIIMKSWLRHRQRVEDGKDDGEKSSNWLRHSTITWGTREYILWQVAVWPVVGMYLKEHGAGTQEKVADAMAKIAAISEKQARDAGRGEDWRGEDD